MSALTIDIVRTVRGRVPTSRAECRTIVACVARVLQKKFSGHLTIVVVGNARMRQLNGAYRGKDHTTDVLSFCYARRGRGRTIALEGELILALPVLTLAARRERTSLRVAATTRIVHGFLHLLGYDHERSAKDERIMFSLQKKVLHRLRKSTERNSVIK